MLDTRPLVSIALTAVALMACGGQVGSDGPIVAGIQDAGGQAAAGQQDRADDAEPAADGRQAGNASRDSDLALMAIAAFIAKQEISRDIKGWKTRLNQPPQLTFDEDSDYFWDLETTKGPIRVKFLPDVAPMHVSSTIYLTELGFYDDIKFHRVIKGFMAQGGDPQGNGSGGPGYKYLGEFDPKVRHNRPGLLSMANTGSEQKGLGPSDGSQFFLTFVPTPHLDGKHTIFGEVTEGMDTVKQLEAIGSRSGATSEPLFIESATIAVEPKNAASD